MGASAPLSEIRLGDGLHDEGMQVFLRRSGLLEVQDLLHGGGRDRWSSPAPA